MRNYGIPYQGSKSRIIKQLAQHFPNADHFYDLFGGGFSVTHFLMKNRAQDFKEFHFNEIRPGVCELIQDAIEGKFNYEVFKPQWISREEFHASNDAYIKCFWSFGNNWKTYLFGKHIEKQKKSMHQAVIFNEFDDFMKNDLKLDAFPENLSVNKRRLFLRRHVVKIKRNSLEQLEQLERLERLQQLERLERLHFYNKDYREILVKPNSVIYCDIPYQNTGKYHKTSEFNRKEFFSWAKQQTNPVFVSEYEIEDPQFEVVAEIKTRSPFSPVGSKRTVEKLFRLK